MGDFILEAPYWHLPPGHGLRSRARSRVSSRRQVVIWANRALGALRQLIRGVLDSSLLNQFFDETVAGASATSHPVSSRVEAVVGRAWERRPSGSPTGAAAATRQRGVDPSLRSPVLMTEFQMDF